MTAVDHALRKLAEFQRRIDGHNAVTVEELREALLTCISHLDPPLREAIIGWAELMVTTARIETTMRVAEVMAARIAPLAQPEQDGGVDN